MERQKPVRFHHQSRFQWYLFLRPTYCTCPYPAHWILMEHKKCPWFLPHWLSLWKLLIVCVKCHNSPPLLRCIIHECAMVAIILWNWKIKILSKRILLYIIYWHCPLFMNCCKQQLFNWFSYICTAHNNLFVDVINAHFMSIKNEIKSINLSLS